MSTNDVPKNFDSCQVADWHITLQIFGGPRCQFVNDLKICAEKIRDRCVWLRCCKVDIGQCAKKITGQAKWRSVAQTWPIVFFFGCNFRASVWLTGVQETVKNCEWGTHRGCDVPKAEVLVLGELLLNQNQFCSGTNFSQFGMTGNHWVRRRC